MIFRGSILEGDIAKGMKIKIPVTDKAVIDVKIDDIVELESHESHEKRTGLVAKFLEEPEALEIVADLNVQSEELAVE